ncbi:Na+/H+ antiporter nha1 [Coniochaeta sp. 2T2.1]|nr:Na+/H+ antiporter nha1 [Coniochaeta sp. 2T2.1]
MAWDHLSITQPHLVYIILGGFTTLFMLCSTVIKERMYIGEATVATLCGIIFGPHAANLIDPNSWGSVDIVTIEFSRIVLVVQCFAVGVELPKFYMEKHWKSVVFLLIPVMTFGWLITSLFVWWMVPPLTWLESLVVAACVTATDPVLASSVVGKGKFAKRVPKHLRDLLSAESGCNDGMAFPFVYLALYLIQEHLSAKDVTYHWLVYTVLYECIFGAIYGFLVGYIARHAIKYAEKKELIDRESFLVFYFVLALFCAGSGSILGVDDLLVGFACGVGFSNDGWFTQKTEESHVSNVIDLLINLAYFVYFGTIIPWEQFNSPELPLSAWRLVVLAIFVLLFRRIPIMMALKPFIPDIKTWREALFAGHFGPIGVGAIFIAILARAELEHEKPVPLSVLPDKDTEYYTIVSLVWPIVSFLVIASILVHGSSIAVFTLGKRINTLSLTMSYTTAPEDGPSWMNRLPRIASTSRSQAKTMSDTDLDEMKLPDFPPGTLPPVGVPGNFLRRQKDDEKNGHNRQNSRASSLAGRRKKQRRWDDGIGPGGPITQSAIFPERRSQSEQTSATLMGDSAGQSPEERRDSEPLSPTGSDRRGEEGHRRSNEDAREREDRWEEEQDQRDAIHQAESHERAGRVEVYDEGNNIIVENQDGDVLTVEHIASHDNAAEQAATLKEKLENEVPAPTGWTYGQLKKRLEHWKNEEVKKRQDHRDRHKSGKSHNPARAYQFGNTIIVEDEDGEVVKKYVLPSERSQRDGPDRVSQGLKYMGMGGLAKKSTKDAAAAGPSGQEGESSNPPPARPRLASVTTWAGAFRPAGGEEKPKKNDGNEEDDRHIRFTISGVDQRMTKEDFLREMRKYDGRTRREILEHSTASEAIKRIATTDKPAEDSAQSSTRGNTRTQQQKPERGAATLKPPTAQRMATTPALPTRGRDETRRSSPSSSGTETSPGATGEASNEMGASSRDAPETAVERRRRLAVLEGVDNSDDEDGVKETPAERRRREAALGMSSQPGEDDSSDDDTPRVPPAGGRRGIRFADQPSRG